MFTKPYRWLALVCCAVLLSAAERGSINKEALFQVSTLDALTLGIYDGSFTVGQLKQHGDFGVGTYEGLDGEMVALDGRYYHVHSNGVIEESADAEKTPFAAVTRFKADVQYSVNNASMAQLGDLLDAVLPSKNLFYAIKVKGTFLNISTRAIPKQFLPYPTLASAINLQAIFPFTNIAGTAVGLRCPAYVKGINQVGYHFHFISDDRKAGGHALSFVTGPVTVQLQTLRQNTLWLPEDQPFLSATLPVQ